MAELPRRMLMTPYALPDLRYDYGALEPYISGKIMELHHDKHHAGYVKGANDTLEQLDEARHKGDLSRLAFLERALAFNLSGHILHSIFWQNLTPKGGGRPDGELATVIERDFGGFDQLKRQMVQAHQPSWGRDGPRWSGSPSGGGCSRPRSTPISRI